MRWVGRCAVILVVLTGVLLAGGRPPAVWAATVTDGDCSSATGFSSLQTAITNAGAGGVVRFTCNGTIPFKSQITISQSVTLDATGHSVTFDGQNATSLFKATNDATLGLIGLTLTRGVNSAIDNEQGTLNIIASSLTSNGQGLNGDGGAIFNASAGTVHILASTFSSNTASDAGGAIFNGGTLTVSNSTFYFNQAFQGNSAIADGGAIFDNDINSTANIANSTFVANEADGNRAGQGGALEGPNMTVNDTILAQNSTSPSGVAPDCGAISGDYNLIDNTSGCTVSGGTHNILNMPASFQSVAPQNNGGPTPTMLLTDGSTGTDYIPLASCIVKVDQRDYARGDGGETTCDIGATETGSTTCVPPTFKTSVSGNPPVASVTATDNNVGIDNLILTASSNATVTIPPFTPGVQSVTATVQRTNPSKPASVSFQAVNTENCSSRLDPAMTALVVSPTQPMAQTITGVAASESRITVINGQPGLTILVVWVNAHAFVVSGLRAGEQRELSVASALHAGSNTIKVLGLGPMGSSATVLIGE